MSDFLDDLIGDATPAPKTRSDVPPRADAGDPRKILVRALPEKDRGHGVYGRLARLMGVTDAALQMSLKRKRFSYWALKACMDHGNASGHKDAPVWSELEPFCM